jgi:nucleotide-binding universal stress UspA family protein
VAAIDGSAGAARVTSAAIELARQRGCPVEIVHVMETDIVGEQAVDAETPEAAAEAIARSVSLLHAAAVPGSGHLLRVAGDHGASGRAIADFARRRQAQLVVIGAPHEGAAGGLFDMALTDQLVRHSPGEVHVVPAEVSQ